MSDYINSVIYVALVLVVVGIAYVWLAAQFRKRRLLREEQERFDTTVNRVLALGEQNQLAGMSEKLGQFRSQVERALKRVEAAEASGVPEAQGIVQPMHRSAMPNPQRLTEYLISARSGAPDLVARNREITTLAFLQGDTATAFECVEAIIAVVPNDLDGHTRLAQIQYLRGEYDAAKLTYRKVLKIAASQKDEAEQALAYENLGTLHLNLQEFNDAEKRFLQAMEIYTHLKQDDGLADCQVSLGLIAQFRKKPEQAEVYFRKAMEINDRLKREEGQAITCGCLGLLLYNKRIRQELDEAEDLLRRALANYEKLGRLGGAATAYGNLGLVRVLRKDTTTARELFGKSLALYRKCNRPKMVIKVQGWLDELQKQDPPEATEQVAVN